MKQQEKFEVIGIFAYLTALNCVDQLYQLNLHGNNFRKNETDEHLSKSRDLGYVAMIFGFALILASVLRLKKSQSQKSTNLIMLSIWLIQQVVLATRYRSFEIDGNQVIASELRLDMTVIFVGIASSLGEDKRYKVVIIIFFIVQNVLAFVLLDEIAIYCFSIGVGAIVIFLLTE